MTEKHAAFFEVGDIILWGKYKNKKGKILRFGDDGKGNPTVEIEPIPKGKKQNKTLGLFKIWKDKDVTARVAERTLAAALVSRVASRYMSAAAKYDEAKIKELLLAYRKGSTGKLENLSKIQAMLEYLGGWRVEPFVGLVKMFYDKGDILTEHDGPLEENFAKLEALKVNSLPSNPKVDRAYVVTLDRSTGHRGKPFLNYTCWVGAAGIKVTSPEGKVFEILPSQTAITGGSASDPPWKYRALGTKTGKFLRFWDLFAWFKKETHLMDQVLAALDMPSKDDDRAQKIRTRDNTGTCSCCFRNIKLKSVGSQYRMVDHGYKRPGHGFQEGNCFGVPYPPFEISAEGTKALIKDIESSIAAAEQQIKGLKSGEILVVLTPRGAVDSNHANWNRAKDWAISDFEANIRAESDMLPQYKTLVAGWKPQELPKEGDVFVPRLK